MISGYPFTIDLRHHETTYFSILQTRMCVMIDCRRQKRWRMASPGTLWFQLKDMFRLIVTPQGIEKVTIQLKDTLTKVYAIGANLSLSKLPLEVIQNWVLIH